MFETDLLRVGVRVRVGGGVYVTENVMVSVLVSPSLMVSVEVIVMVSVKGCRMGGTHSLAHEPPTEDVCSHLHWHV